ncbi:MAG TPA: biotin/lipoyl-containing protein, partial [Candidatus Nanopelagicales bacterium]
MDSTDTSTSQGAPQGPVTGTGGLPPSLPPTAPEPAADPRSVPADAPPTGLVAVPVLVDVEGQTWTLPACRVVPGATGRDIIETTELPPALHDVVLAAALAEARDAGPGPHCSTYAMGAGAAPRPAEPPLDCWPLAEELLGLDLPEGAWTPTGGRALLAWPAPPEPSGHAVAAHLRAPQAADGAPLRHLRLPVGPGIRVLSHAEVGDAVGSDVVLRVVAHGRDRDVAMRRLHHALRDSAVVVDGAGSNRCALLAVLATHAGRTTRPATSTAPDPLAVLVAAVRAADAQRAIQQAAFHARAARGRPEPANDAGVPVTLIHGGQRYELVVHRTGPDRYRIEAGDQVAELGVQRDDDYEWTVTCAGTRHHVVGNGHGSGCLLEIDGVAHRVDREEGVPVRAEWPALIVSLAVAPGQEVAPGDPLVVVEAMKMESTIRATFAGTVTAVDVLPNEQVDAGMPLLRIRPPADDGAPISDAPGTRVSFAGMALADTSGRPPFERVFDALSNYLLGYDLDPVALRGLLAEQRAFANRASAGDPSLLAAEDAFLDLFSELGLLWQADRVSSEERTGALVGGTTSAREYLIGYLQWLDPDRIGMPDPIRRRLTRVLARYGVTDLRRNPALEDAVVLLFGAQARLPKLAAVVTSILERRLRYRDRILPLTDTVATGVRYDRLSAATQGQLEAIADLARDARFRFVDEPVVEAGRGAVAAEMEAHLAALTDDPRRADRAERITALVECPQPMRETILRHRIASGVDPDLQSALLEVRARRWYRTRPLRDIRIVQVEGVQFCVADYDWEHRRIHLMLTFAPLSGLADLGRAIATHLADVPAERSPVVDVMCWRPDSQPNGDDLAEALRADVAGWQLGRPLWRLDLTISSLASDVDPEYRTQYVTFRTGPDGEPVEDRFYRNLHPMLAKRLELWRLANFDLTRLPSTEDVYLFHGVAKQNPKDHRLFALAEVRDMTALPGGRAGRTSYPMLERMGLQSIIAMRRARATFAERDRPQANRITLFVRRPWDVPRDHWGDLAEMLVPLAGGAGLEMVVIRTSLREPDGSLRPVVLNVDGIIQRSITITEEPPRDDIVRPLTRYRQKVLTSQRFGVPYPFEILRMFAPPPGTVGKFKPAHFEELDLDESGEGLVPVLREPGLNASNLVVGLLTSYTDAYPEGMTRVAMLSDPTRGLGNLAEPECRRVNACLALAAERGIPVEWFAVSSGALISMESGTENMDWIALTLRRIIEFTQGGGEINVIVTGINVGGQPYWNAEATMLMH